MVIFATSHSKSPCKGVGGTVKRFTAMKSLRHPFHNKILSVDAMMACCSSHLTKISSLELSSKELLQLQVKLEQRFHKAVTIKEIRAFDYHIKYIGATRLGVKRISDDKQFSLKADIISSL